MQSRRIILYCLFGLLLAARLPAVQPFVTTDGGGFVWIANGKGAPVLTDSNEYPGVLRAINNLCTDAAMVTDVRPVIHNDPRATRCLIIGSLEQSQWIKELVRKGMVREQELKDKREKYLIQTVRNPLPGVEEAVVIAGSDKRGTIYGVYELAAQMGVSPWYYWADVPVQKHASVGIRSGVYTDGEPAVKYRGIFLNDEAPALTGWAQETFGGLNSRFYEKVFELILRLKGNFLWPAMWNNAFYDDDPLNGPLADETGIVIGTTHHEPMAQAQQDWKRRGSGPWDYSRNGQTLRDFWAAGIERSRAWESLITVGMRGDGDEPMSEEANIALLKRIVSDQRKIMEKVTGRKAEQTPQVWALYKEVQEYYDKGMRVPDDITLLLCDDNWGNVRKLPALTDKPRKGGYGMYYHFDYVGGPRNSKWLNITQVQRTWEQMNLTYEHGVRELWVVNVGDLKPMEYPVTFWFDMAWDPARFNAGNLLQHTERFCARQFGEEHAREAARLIDQYTRFNRRITPELLNENTYSLRNYNEWERVKDEYRTLSLDALRLYHQMPESRRDAFDQLVLFPIQACANLYEMYHAVAMNHALAARNNSEANGWARKVQACYERDSLLTYHYNKVMSGGKWNHMMDQTHIGYTNWQQPERQVMPQVKLVPEAAVTTPLFVEKDGYVSIEAEHYTRSLPGGKAGWTVIPGLGRTLSGVTTLPCTETPDEAMALEYDILFADAGEAKVIVRLSATLNFNDRGLRYAVSFDGEEEQIVNFNGHYRGELGQWQAEHVIHSATNHRIDKAGKHTLRFRAPDPGVVLQKIMIDRGSLQPSRLGAPESERRQQEAGLKLPALISDGMVLQRERPVKLWGTAQAGESVRVTFAGQEPVYTTTAGAQGDWSVTLPPMPAGGPYTLQINEIEVKDVCVGDVWLCSGQSNMELPMSRVTDLFRDEMQSYDNPQIRYLKVPYARDFHSPQSDIPREAWKPLNRENAPGYAALCYFFAKAMYEKNGVPVGLINSSMGGTPIEAWISEEGLREFPLYLNDKRRYEDDDYINQLRLAEGRGQYLWDASLRRADPGLHEQTPWYAAGYDDSGWEKTDLFAKAWAGNGLNPLNGSHWFRRQVEIPAGWEGQEAVLRLGCITDADSVYVNGTFAGATSYQYPPRIYTLPAGLLKAGENTITIRLISKAGYPQFVEEKPYKLICNGRELSLEGEWKRRTGAVMPAAPSQTGFNNKATGLYNGMIAPLLNYAVRGVIWYQGESNVSRRNEYAGLLTALTADWRTKFNAPRLPFYITELAGFLAPDDPGRRGWEEMQRIQQQAAEANPHTRFIRNSDLGEWNDIHPLDKKTPARRIAESVWEDMQTTGD
jgi:hypothetical protein